MSTTLLSYLATSLATALPLLAAGAFAAAKARTKIRHLTDALNYMSQGLCMFDAAARIVVCNRQYVRMYGLSPEVVKPGSTLRTLM